jgi:hypothetical protein
VDEMESTFGQLEVLRHGGFEPSAGKVSSHRRSHPPLKALGHES